MVHIEYIKLRRRILFVVLLVVIVLANGCSKKPEQSQKTYRIGILCGLDYIATIPEMFKAGMTELGYIQGQNIFYDTRRTNFEPEKEKEILRQFIRKNVDLIFTFPTEVSIAAKAAADGTGIPVLFCFANIEGTGLVESVPEPGGNITGVRYPGPDLAIKRFEIMLELAPQAKRIWVPYQRGYPIVDSQLEVLHPVAKAVGVTLIEFPADDAAEVEAELDSRRKLDDVGIDAILFLAEPLAVTPDAFEVMGEFADEYDLPIGGALIRVGEYGSIFGINVNIKLTAWQAALLADKILRGTPAGLIPVVSSESYFEVDYKAAQQLQVKVPEGVLSRADKIIN